MKKDRVTDPGCRFLGVFGQKGCFVLGLLEVQFVQDLLEFLTVFRQIDAFGRSANDVYACFLEPGGEIERGLPAILNDCPVAPFLIVDFQNILESERLKVQAVRGIVISGHGLGVGIESQSQPASRNAKEA